MKKHVLFGVVFFLWIFSTGSICFAKTLPLSSWSIPPESRIKTTTIKADQIVLMQYSPIQSADLDLEISEVRIMARNPNLTVDTRVTLTVQYDDLLSANVLEVIPRSKTKYSEVVFPLPHHRGRKVKSIQLRHGATAIRIEISRISVVPAPRVARSINTALLGGARLNAHKNLQDSILFVRHDDKAGERPSISGLKSGVINIHAAKTRGLPERPSNMTVRVFDSNNKSLKNIQVSLSVEYRDATIDFSDLHLAKVDRVEFQSWGTGVVFAIRDIRVGTAQVTHKGDCRQIVLPNARFRKLVDRWRSGKLIHQSRLAELEELLKLYEAVEQGM